MSVHIDHAALARLAKSAQMKPALRATAEQVAANVRAQHIPVGDDVKDGVGHTIDIPVELTADGDGVLLAHPAGVAVQAKYGALTKAASAAGLHVHG